MTGAANLGGSELFALLDDSRNAAACTSALYHGDARLIECRSPDAVDAGFARIEQELQQGRYIVGLFGFELGYCLEARLRDKRYLAALDAPLFRALSFAKRSTLDAASTTAWLEQMAIPHPAVALIRKARLNMTRAIYRSAIERVLRYIRDGDTYQVNFTLQYQFDYDGHPLRIYQRLRERQRVEYGALIRLPDEWVLSLSPELFFKRDGEAVIAKPMKGTSRRGGTPREDMMRGAWLKEDEKNLAENVMIVDLIRNDLGRLARTGSVRVDPLFEIEPYQTVLQMTSTVHAQVPREVSTLRLLRELFPCGSITGAPKIRTMEIIAELEAAPRGLYTGAIGAIQPNGDASFNVAIRTALLEPTSDMHGSGVMGVGSGVVADSVPDDEFEECQLKGRFLTELGSDFELIESLRWSHHEGCSLLQRHLERLRRSADHFGFLHDEQATQLALQEHTARLSPGGTHKVRLTLARDGTLRLSSEAISEAVSIKRVVVSDRRIDSRDPLYAHKTTRRALYDQEFARAQREHGAYETLFFNERDELAEGSRSNVILEIGGVRYTPALASGCLPGVMRAQLLAEHAVFERVLLRTELPRAERIFVCNAVRGVVEVRLGA